MPAALFFGAVSWVGALSFMGSGSCGSDDTKTLEILAPLNHKATRQSVTAERALLMALGGGCQVPIGAYGKIVGNILELSGCIAAMNGESIVRAVHTGDATKAEQIGADLARTLLDMGGKELLAPVQ